MRFGYPGYLFPTPTREKSSLTPYAVNAVNAENEVRLKTGWYKSANTARTPPLPPRPTPPLPGLGKTVVIPS
jgi:hypothetical protein